MYKNIQMKKNPDEENKKELFVIGSLFSTLTTVCVLEFGSLPMRNFLRALKKTSVHTEAHEIKRQLPPRLNIFSSQPRTQSRKKTNHKKHNHPLALTTQQCTTKKTCPLGT